MKRYILRSSLIKVGHLGLGEPDGLSIEADPQIEAAIAVDEELTLRGAFVGHVIGPSPMARLVGFIGELEVMCLCVH